MPARRTILPTLIVLTAFVVLPAPFSAAPLDYGGYRPHYQGYGVNTPGGRFGTVLRVTNLNDSGPGSLRAAVTTPGARFVIFETSGTIHLATPLVVTQPYVTIAGQTAPSPGILLRGPGLVIDAHDVVVQHLRVRVGALSLEPHGVWMRDNAHNVVVDHVSISWSVWTSLAVNTYTPGKPSGEVTIIDSLIAEGLACSGKNTYMTCDPATYPQGGGYSNSKAVLIGDGWNHPAQKVTMLRTISANNNERHPEIGGRTHTMVINNLIYNPSLTPLSAISYHDGFGKGTHLSVVKGNLLVPGPTTPGHNGYVPPEHQSAGEMRMIRVHPTVTSDSQIYLDGNYYAKHCGSTACLASPSAQWMLAADTKMESQGVSPRVMTPPLSLANLPLSSVLRYDQVEEYLTANAGARPLDRDAVDSRIISEIVQRRGSVPNDPSEKAGPGTGTDGFPILAVNRRVLTVPSAPHDVIDAVGRTRIESWLEGFARELEPASQGGGVAAPRGLRLMAN